MTTSTSKGYLLKNRKLIKTNMVVSVTDKRKVEETKITNSTRRRKSRQNRNKTRRYADRLERLKPIKYISDDEDSVLEESNRSMIGIEKRLPSLDRMEDGMCFQRLKEGMEIETKNTDLFSTQNTDHFMDDGSISSGIGSTTDHTKSSFDRELRKKRWWKTVESLHDSGLLSITMKTAELLRKNQQIQKEIESLQKETKKFVVSVLSNPENIAIMEDIKSHSDLYELIVPGSQRIMSVTTNFDKVSTSTASSVSTSNLSTEPSSITTQSPSCYDHSEASSPLSSPNTGSLGDGSSDEETFFASN